MMRPIDPEDDPRPPASGALWTTLPMLLPRRPWRPGLVAGGVAAVLAVGWAATAGLGAPGPAVAAALVCAVLCGWVVYRNLR